MSAHTLNREHHVLFLSSQIEMKHPYDRALKNLGIPTTWLQSWEKLIESPNPNQITTLVVDLDILAKPLMHSLEAVRTRFSRADIIALSSEDSAKLVVESIKAGIGDFLIKPVSPEELVLSVRKSLDRQNFVNKLGAKTSLLLRATSQISAAGSAPVLRIVTLEALRVFFKAEGALWLSRPKDITEFSKIVTHASPSTTQNNSILNRLKKYAPFNKQAYRWRCNGKRRVLLLGRHLTTEGIYICGIPNRVGKKSISEASLIVEQAELALLNMEHVNEIKQQTFIDDLTGLYNSRYLRFALQAALLKSQNKDIGFSIFFIDLDHFKSVNDKHGHLVGSEFLVTIGRSIKHTVRSIDPVFRYGGDEFVVVLQDTSLSGAMEIAERIRKNIERRVFVINGNRLSATVSIGVAHFPTHAADIEKLLVMADEAMYNAKRKSRNAVSIASNEAGVLDTKT